MKRLVSILLAALMLVSVFAIPAAARGYTLSVDKTGMGHNLESFIYWTERPGTTHLASCGATVEPENNLQMRKLSRLLLSP